MDTTFEGPQKLVVVGSINFDRSVRVQEIPLPGETVISTPVHEGLGGKGANQAIAAAAAGAEVQMIGNVGDGLEGEALLNQLNLHGVNTSLIAIDQHSTTGSAFIVVNSLGENVIYVTLGANGSVNCKTAYASIQAALVSSRTSITLCQGELPPRIVDMAARSARSHNSRFVLNLAPFGPVSFAAISTANPLVLNETEARSTLNYLTKELLPNSKLPITEDSNTARIAAQLSQYAKSTIITLGSEGCIVAVNGEVQHIAALLVEDVVDTSGAGDAFVGVACAALLRGADLAEAARCGAEAGANAVRYSGANTAANMLRSDANRKMVEYDQ